MSDLLEQDRSRRQADLDRLTTHIALGWVAPAPPPEDEAAPTRPAPRDRRVTAPVPEEPPHVELPPIRREGGHGSWGVKMVEKFTRIALEKGSGW